RRHAAIRWRGGLLLVSGGGPRRDGPARGVEWAGPATRPASADVRPRRAGTAGGGAGVRQPRRTVRRVTPASARSKRAMRRVGDESGDALLMSLTGSSPNDME